MANSKSKSLSWLILFLWLVIPSAYSSNYSSYRCNNTCGSVIIPRPFGIGRDCALNDWFSITCNYSHPLGLPVPYLDKLKLRVRDVSLRKQTLTVVTPVSSYCSHNGSVTWNSSNLTGSPFYYSKDYNRLMLFGCGNALLLGKNGNNILSGCMSTCHESVRNTDVNGCYGIFCCETSIPFYLSEYKLNFTSSVSDRSGLPCNYAFLAEQNWFPSDYSDPFIGRSSRSVAVALTWTIQSYDQKKSLSDSCFIVGNKSLQVESGQFVGTYTCVCSWGDALCASNYIYSPDKKNKKPVIVGVSTSIGVLILVAASFMSYKLINRIRVRKMKEKFFKRNGGLLLQKQLSIGDSVIERTTIFTAEELEKATDNFNANRILGRGGQGTVYKGMLTDGRIVAVKRSKLVDDSDEFQIKQFINEVVVLSQVIHKNVVKLLGCCLETEVPLLVYEFIANGTLLDLIHAGGGDDNDQTDEHEFLTWNVRLRIATEAAGALAYLHSAVSIPIYHRDIKSTNILLDEKYTAKVSDFGTSRTIAIDRTHITTLVQGTFGYLDPEYFQSSQFTDKSDVYSFGVVLVELLTGQKAISSAGGARTVDGEDSRNLSLATRFLVSMDENRVDEILDAQVLCHDRKEDIIGVAKLAERCLNLNGKKRPTMKEVAFELERIRVSKLHPPSLASKFQSLECIQEDDEEESLMVEEFSCSISTSTTGSSSITSGSSSDTSPLLFNTV